MAQGVKIRAMCEADVVAVAILSEACGFSGWKEPDYRKSLIEDRTIAFVANILQRDNLEAFAGFLLARLIMPQVEILNVATIKEFREKGIGRRLVLEVICEAKRRGAESILLEVRESNLAAKSLYESCGFGVVGRRKKYYARPFEDALTMTMCLI